MCFLTEHRADAAEVDFLNPIGSGHLTPTKIIRHIGKWEPTCSPVEVSICGRRLTVRTADEVSSCTRKLLTDNAQMGFEIVFHVRGLCPGIEKTNDRSPPPISAIQIIPCM